MKKRGIIIISLLIALSITLSLVNARYEKNDYKIQKFYRAGETIKGYINLTLFNEPASSLFSSNFLGNITLINLLKANNLNSDKDFQCTTNNCTQQYTLGSGLSDFNLEDSKVLGLQISGGDIEEISSLKFKIESDLTESCSTPLIINFLNSEQNLLTSTTYKDETCASKSTGCFNSSLAEYTEVIIENFELCEDITINPAPAYRIGARIRNSTKGSGMLEMKLYAKENTFSCVLPNMTAQEQDLDCIIKYSSPIKTNFTVCITSRNYASNGPDFQIRAENKNPICGNPSRDFEIFAKPLKYDKTSMEINSTLFDSLFSITLEDYIYEYLTEKYPKSENGVKCDPKCLIPISITGPAQKIKISDIDLRFRDGGLSVAGGQYRQIYELTRAPIEITSNALKLDLANAKFTIPLTSKENMFRLLFNNRLLFEERINVSESFDFDINPKLALIGLNTIFEVITSYNVTSSTWNFGDGKTEEAAGKRISHTYPSQGTFNLEVTLKRKDGIIAIKKFTIIVGNPKESADLTIKEYNSRLVNITNQLKNFQPWIADKILEKLNIQEINESFKKLESNFSLSNTDEEFVYIINELLKLKIPKRITITKEGKLPLAVGFENINVNFLEEISKHEIEDEEGLRKRIISWMSENYDADAEFKHISAVSDNSVDNLATTFTLNINKKSTISDQAYLFINYPFEGIIFETNQSQQPVSDGSGAYIDLSDVKKFTILIEDEIELESLGAYISPDISVFSIIDDGKEFCPPDDPKCKPGFPGGKLLFWLAIVFAFFLISYLILQEWYKRNYESHLFKNREDLHNLINFIYNSRAAELSDSEIKNKLKNAGWKKEQIIYAIRKLEGKRTGMWEIPIFKPFENLKIKRELEKRQYLPLNAKFIKRPNL